MSRRGAVASRVVPEDLRRYNRGVILEQICLKGVSARTDLAAATGLTGAAVSRITRELLDAGLLREQQAANNGRGRPVLALDLAPEGAFVIGVGIGAYEQWIQIANLRGESISRRALELLNRKSPQHALNEIVRQARAMAREGKIPWDRILGMTAAVAGVVDESEGRVLYSPNIGWTGALIGTPLGKALGLPVYVEALHHVLNLAEARVGTTRGAEDVVLVNAALGIGASVMEKGHIVRGCNAAAGQIGHIHVQGAKDLCTCGRRGCLDTVASGYAVLRRLGIVDSRRIPKEHDASDARRLAEAIDRERHGDPKANVAFRDSGKHLGEALGVIRSLLDPERIVIAGPLAQTASYIDGICDRLEAQGVDASVLSLASQTGDSAAARLALSRFVFCPDLDLSRLID